MKDVTNGEIIDRNAREAQTYKILMLAQELKNEGKDIEAMIETLKSMLEGK